MKVLHVTTHINIGGIANYILNLAGELKKSSVECIVASSGGNLEKEFSSSGIETKFIGIKTKSELSPKVFLSAPGIARLIRELNVDMVHAHTRVSQVASFFASRTTGVPYVSTCHGFFKKKLGRRLLGCWGDRVIAISEPVRDSLINDFNLKPERIEVIYSGVDIDKFSKTYSESELAGIRNRAGLKGGPVIGTIGRLSPVKGHRFFIEAMQEVAARSPGARALIVGDGKEEEFLKSLAISLGLEDMVHFVRSDPDTRKFLAVMDVFVFPSIKEGLGIGLLEALASGRPCVASGIGGISDIISSGISGILVPPADARAISSSVLQLLRDEGLRRKIAAQGRELVKEKFSLASMAGNTLRFYERTLRKGVI